MTKEIIVESFFDNFNFFSKNLVNGRVKIDKNNAIVNGNKNIPSLKAINTTSKIKAIYTRKYNFLKSKFL